MTELHTNDIHLNVLSQRRTTSTDTDTVSTIEEENYPDGGWKAYSVLCGSFLGLVVNMGLINSIGAIQAYVSTHQLAGVAASSVAWIFSIYLALAYAIGIFIGPIFDRHGALELLVIATILLFAGLMGTASSTKISHFILSFICIGIGNGVGLTPLVAVINHWFFKRRGNSTGIATSGGSVGGLVFPLMLRHMYSTSGFVWAIRTLAFVCLGCMVSAVILARERLTREPDPPADSESKWKTFSNKIGLFSLSKLKNRTYALMITGVFCTELSLVLILTYFATYAMAQGVSESTSYLLLTVWNATGILGRWIPALASDYYGKFNVNIVMIFGLDLCVFMLWLPFGSSLKVLYAFAAVGGYFSGSILTMVPSCLAQISPVSEFGERYGILNAVLSLGNLVGLPIGAAIIGNGSVHNYTVFVGVVGVLLVTGTFFWILSRASIVGARLNVKV
ncbi:hypothetical protein PGUG_01089 [Meyerozyma guilliermondii ATCC 6260]|uniref:Major facilitator superfamily (MFS) profile domain-containing protein n=1 Tax=Meyerozyma guilliermondii (strain ATCC 6260 / CBS 566 / DSM 6381 / JCM 1539 / NBRC 10279 / NRRL Y-324) TaxID=294746 RepID=A5DCT4_PICGU|nr:uncharacterized protein PGUG_01089 [Meyerozyma guilliermondii ATCC 6260]EDK36991.2 hypothetical protein PGUG_01089 [Meyerozyma guilliermondii ATCC 6260]